jgi:arylsulfatase A-like enzyme
MVLLVLFACRPTGPDVVLVVVDTLRMDHVGAYGQAPRQGLTPVMDALAEQSMVYDRAYASSPWTMPSTATLFTGLSPYEHGVRTGVDDIPLELETVAEHYADKGYTTCAVQGNLLLKSLPGFQQGFDGWHGGPAGASAYTITSEAITDLALDCLQTRGPRFVYVHYFDPHNMYLDHEGIDWAPASGDTLTGKEQIDTLRDGFDALTPADLEFLRALYTEEVHFTDQQLGRLLDAVDPEALVVLTSDHGEELGERGWLGHTITLNEELVKVPLLVRDGTVGRSSELVPASSVGQALLRGEFPVQPTRRVELEVLFAPEGDHDQGLKDVALVGVVEGDNKQVRDLKTAEVWRYDLAADPGELQRLPADPSVVFPAKWDESASSTGVMTPEREEALRALGYMD